MLIVPFLGVAFGSISRACERQADLFGSRAASLAPPAVDDPPEGWLAHWQPSTNGHAKHHEAHAAIATEAGPKMDFLFSIPYLPQILIVVVLFVAYQQIASRVTLKGPGGGGGMDDVLGFNA